MTECVYGVKWRGFRIKRSWPISGDRLEWSKKCRGFSVRITAAQNGIRNEDLRNKSEIH
jgi:hypothetical protein